MKSEGLGKPSGNGTSDTYCYRSSKIDGCVLPAGALLLLLPQESAQQRQWDAQDSQPFLFLLIGAGLQKDNIDLVKGDSMEADLDACDRTGGIPA